MTPVAMTPASGHGQESAGYPLVSQSVNSWRSLPRTGARAAPGSVFHTNDARPPGPTTLTRWWR